MANPGTARANSLRFIKGDGTTRTGLLTAALLAAIFAALLVSRLLHAGVVWVEEAYPAAGAIQMLAGKTLYRDVWFDKPPLSAALYLLWGARMGWPLRVADTLYLFAGCALLWRFAREMWGRREATLASALLAFFLIFGWPAAVMALAPDLEMLLPHVAAVYLAWKKRAWWCGLACGIAMLMNPKAAAVVIVCVVWLGARECWKVLPGSLAPTAAAFACYGRAYYEQVWQWGALYSADTFLAHPVREGIVRTLGWAGFQAALVVGALVFFVRERNRRERLRFAVWIAVMLAAVAAGWRFYPRYYFALLPPMALAAARGWMLVPRRAWIALAALLLVPAIRFGPGYLDVAGSRDLLLANDSRDVARIIDAQRAPGDTLLVWGYRPAVFALTRMPAGTRFLDSQPLTGVIADRHLTISKPSAPELARRNRAYLATTRPAWVVDGLGPLNPALTITNYPDLREWLAHYREVGRTRDSVLYHLAILGTAEAVRSAGTIHE